MPLLSAILEARANRARSGPTDGVRCVRPDLLLGDLRSARLPLGRFVARGGGRPALPCVLARDLPDVSAWSPGGPGGVELERQAWVAGVELSPAGSGDRSTIALEALAAPGRCFATLGSVPEAGALGALAIEVGELEALDLLCGEDLEVEMGSVRRVELEGSLPPRCDGHDVAAALIAARPAGFHGAWVEVAGAGVAALSMSDRVAMCRTLSAAGARAVLFPCDERTRDELRRRGREADWRATDAGPAAEDAQVFDLGWTVPHAISLARPTRAVPLAWWAGVGVASVEIGPGLPPETLAWCAGLLRGRPVSEGTSLRVHAWSTRASTSAESAETVTAFTAAGARWIREGELAAWKRRAGRLRLYAGTTRSAAGADGDDWSVGASAAIEAACRGRIDPPEAWPDPGEIAVPVAAATAPVVLASLRAAGPAGVAGAQGSASRSATPVAISAARRLPGVTSIGLRGAVLGRLEGNLEADSLLPMGPRLESLLARPERLAEHAVPAARRGNARSSGRWLVVLGELRGLERREAGLLALRSLGVRGILAAGIEAATRGLLARAGILGLRALRAEDLDAILAGDELELVGGLDTHVPDRARVVRNLTRGFALVALPELTAREWNRVAATSAGGEA